MAADQNSDIELADNANRIVARRIVVGALDTNCWILFSPGERSAIIVDPGDEPLRILDACHDLSPVAVVLTHQHWDHVLALPDVADAYGVDVLAHRDDAGVWPGELRHLDQHGHFDAGTATAMLLKRSCHIGPPPDRALWPGTTRDVSDGETIRAGELELTVLHTPGHTPGGISLALPGHVFSGDTLFPGGPGLTGWPLSDFDTIIDSIRRRLFSLPDHTSVHPGHGRSTTLGAEAPSLPEWIERGW